MIEDKVRGLEAKEKSLMLQSIEEAKTGCVSSSIQQGLAEVRAELKTARRIRAMDAKRTDPKLTRKISLLLPVDEYQELTKRAAKAGVDLSKYIRELIKNDPQSGGEGSF